MMRVLAAVCAALSFVPMAFAEGPSETVTSFALDNGMQVVVVEDHRAPVVQHMV